LEKTQWGGRKVRNDGEECGGDEIGFVASSLAPCGPPANLQCRFKFNFPLDRGGMTCYRVF